MPYRKTPIVEGEFYHVYNRSIASQPIFMNKRDYERAMETVNYYFYEDTPIRFSHFNRLNINLKNEMIKELLSKGKSQIKILSYCFMSNHYHFLLREIKEKGISDFIRNFQNSYAKYFNKKRGRSGSLFQAMFKAIRIESDEQLLHLARYIHLNPLSSHHVKDANSLLIYKYSSLYDYINNTRNNLLSKNILLDHYPTKKKLISYTLDQADYQQKLERIKHIIVEKPYVSM